MFQRAKSFIIKRKKDADEELELPDSSHLVRKPVTANMQDRINFKLIQKNPVVGPTVDFSTLRQKSNSLESVSVQRTNLHKTPMVLSTDGLDTIRRKKEQQQKKLQRTENPSSSVVKPAIQKSAPGDSKNKVKKSDSQKRKLFRVNSKKKKNQDSNDQRSSFIFVKMADK